MGAKSRRHVPLSQGIFQGERATPQIRFDASSALSKRASWP